MHFYVWPILVLLALGELGADKGEPVDAGRREWACAFFRRGRVRVGRGWPIDRTIDRSTFVLERQGFV